MMPCGIDLAQGSDKKLSACPSSSLTIGIKLPNNLFTEFFRSIFVKFSMEALISGEVNPNSFWLGISQYSQLKRAKFTNDDLINQTSLQQRIYNRYMQIQHSAILTYPVFRQLQNSGSLTLRFSLVSHSVPKFFAAIS